MPRTMGALLGGLLLYLATGACDCGENRITHTWSELVAQPNPVAFGQVPVSTTKSIDVTLSNKGTATVYLHDLQVTEDPEDFSLSIPKEVVFPYTIAPGGQVVFTVIYHPQKYPEEDHGTVHIKSTDKTAPEYDLPCTGTAVEPILLIDPDPVDFGSVRVLATKPATLTITDTGSNPNPVKITMLELTDNGGGNFALVDAEKTPVTLNPNDKTTVHLTYTPKAISDADQGTFTIESDAQSQEHMEVQLLGKSHAPHIEVSTTALNFGTVSRGSNPSLPFTIHSTGTDPLTITSMQLVSTESQMFSLDPASIAAPIPAGSSVDVKVTFLADNRGDEDGTLQIKHDDPLQQPVFIKLHGRTPAPKVDIQPDLASIQIANLAHTQTLDIKIFNLGDEDLKVLSCTFDNPNGSFSIDAQPTYPATVAPGTEPAGPFATVTVRFTKDTQTDNDMCTLTFATDDPTQPSVVVTVIGKYTP